MPSSWDGENHKGPHWILTIFPNGKLVLTTAEHIPLETVEHVRELLTKWLASDQQAPLIIGDCLVQLTPVNPREVTIDVPGEEPTVLAL